MIRSEHINDEFNGARNSTLIVASHQPNIAAPAARAPATEKEIRMNTPDLRARAPWFHLGWRGAEATLFVAVIIAAMIAPGCLHGHDDSLESLSESAAELDSHGLQGEY